jgi:negative regulator of flagellin synthesis FlgM
MKIPGDSSVLPSKVNGMDAKSVRVAPGSGVHKRLDQPAGKAGSGAGSDTDVQLTGAARNLAAIEQSLRELPAIDELRVATVKQRLESGEYQVDAQRVADKLLAMERDFERRAPLDRNPLK